MIVTMNYKRIDEAFVCNQKYNQNIYKIYIQNRVLYHRIFTRDELLKMKSLILCGCIFIDYAPSIKYAIHQNIFIVILT